MQREKKILNAASIAAKALDCSMFNTDRCIIDGVSFFTIPSSFNTSDSTLIVVVYLYFLNIAHFCALYNSAINCVSEKQDSGASEKRISLLTAGEIKFGKQTLHNCLHICFKHSNYSQLRLKILTTENHIKRKGPVQSMFVPRLQRILKSIIRCCYVFLPFLLAAGYRWRAVQELTTGSSYWFYTCTAYIHVKSEISWQVSNPSI